MKTPVRAIRWKCLDCQGGRPSQVRLCEMAECPLFAYRMGKNPRRAGIGGKKGRKNMEIAAQVGVFGRNEPPPIQVCLPLANEAGSHV